MNQPILDAAPYYNPNVIRRRPTDMGTIYAKSTGGPPPEERVLSRPGWQGAYDGATTDRAPSGYNDTLILRSRGIIYRKAYYLPPATGAGNLSWTAAGPIKDMPTTRFSRNLRPIVGGSNQDKEGMHTNLPTGQQQPGGQLRGRNAMVAGRQNRLSVQRYRGQSYSQTTKPVN